MTNSHKTVFCMLILCCACVFSKMPLGKISQDRLNILREGATSNQDTAEAYVGYLEKRLSKIQIPVGEVKGGEWLAIHKERGQTFLEYLKYKKKPFDTLEKKIVLVGLGEFDSAERHILQENAEYLSLVFGLPCEILPPIPLDTLKLPQKAFRYHPRTGQLQFLTTFLLYEKLKSLLTDKTAALVGFTTDDVYAKGFNFVFGQASLSNRIGVWSLNRFGDPQKEYEKVFRRSLKTSVHETGHIFSMRHCTAYRCLMGGSNNLRELDRKPLNFCPQCLAKICWYLGKEETTHLKELALFWVKRGGVSPDFETLYFQKALKTLVRE